MGLRILAAMLALVSVACSSSSDAGQGCDWQSGTHTTVVDGLERTYTVTVTDPDGPVVLGLHGASADRQVFEDITNLGEDGRGVVITPETVGLWWDTQADSADQEYLADLLCGDDVHAVGFSSGGMMAIRLACEGVVDSAVVVGGMVDVADCERRPPLLAIHGTADESVGFDGSMGSEMASFLAGYEQGPTVPDLVDRWGEAELVVHDGGHLWPDDATARVWDFVD